MIYYYVLENSYRQGPLVEEQILSMLSSGRITAESLCWKEGMSEWKPLGEVRPDLFGGGVHLKAPAEENAGLSKETKSARSKEARVTVGVGGRPRPIGALFVMVGGIAVLLGVLAIPVVLAAPSGQWRLLPDMVRSVFSNGPSARLNPAKPPESGSAPLRLAPFDGLRIRAPANALDKPRDFRVSRLSDADLVAVSRETALANASALMAVKVESGMEEFERYPGEVSFEVDLRELEIPEGLWGNVGVLQQTDEGEVLVLHTKRKGSTLSFSIQQNSVILTYLIYTAGAIIIPAGSAALIHRDLKTIPQGPYVTFNLPEADQFYIHLGTDEIPFRNPGEVERVIDEMNHMRRERGLVEVPKESLRPPFAVLPNALPLDRDTMTKEWELTLVPEYKALMGLWKDQDWVKENVIPINVYHVGRALRKAKEYLQVRGFRWPSYKINVYIPDIQMSGFGYMDDAYFTRPFIVLNRNGIPTVGETESGWDDEAQGCWDNLNTTVVHELFHVVQTRYFWIPEIRGREQWFWEATAVLLEKDARSYYLNRSDWSVQSWHGTVGSYSVFNNELDYYAGEQLEKQEHGYGSAYFLAHLRDRYYRLAPNAFLHTLMEDFSAFRGGRLKSLYRVTSNSSSQFGREYHSFVRDAADNFYLDGNHESELIHAGSPYEFWPHTEIKELRSEVIEFRLRASRSAGPRDLDEVVMVFKDEEESFSELGVSYELRLWDPFSSRWRNVVDMTGVSVPKNWEQSVTATMRTSKIEFKGCQEIKTLQTDSNPIQTMQSAGIPFRLQRIEPNIMTLYTTWNRSAGKGVHAFALFKPTAKPRFSPRWNENEIDIHIPPSEIAQKELLEGYLVTVERWEAKGGQQATYQDADLAPVPPRLQFFLPMDEHTIDIAPLLGADKSGFPETLSSMLGPISIDEFMEMIEIWRAYLVPPSELRVTYREVVSKDKRIFGPESEPFSLPIESMDLLVDPTGSWECSVWIARRPLRMDISRSGGKDIEGSLTWGEPLGFRGVWEPHEKGWAVQLFEEGPRGNMALGMFTMYLRPLPNNRLWLAAPPCVLKNPVFEERRRARESEKEGFFQGWRRWLSGGSD